MKKLKGKKLVRQGDVFIGRANKVPRNLDKYRTDERNRSLLALGEVTGHAHAVVEPIEVFGIDIENYAEDKYIKSDVDFTVSHEEHSSITFEKGDAISWIQREYTPQEIVRVRD